MSRRLAALVFVLMVLGAAAFAWNGIERTNAEFRLNEFAATGAPQQEVVASWAIMDLLEIVIWMLVGLIAAIAWHALSRPKPDADSSPGNEVAELNAPGKHSLDLENDSIED